MVKLPLSLTPEQLQFLVTVIGGTMILYLLTSIMRTLKGS
jgi:hypothetical protein